MICERLFFELGFIDQVLGSMIRGMDYHQSHTQKGSSLLFLGGKHLGYGACLSFPFMIPILS
jgi:hypothetical protein